MKESVSRKADYNEGLGISSMRISFVESYVELGTSQKLFFLFSPLSERRLIHIVELKTWFMKI